MQPNYKRCPVCNKTLQYNRRAGEQIQKCIDDDCRGASRWREEYEWEMFVDDELEDSKDEQ